MHEAWLQQCGAEVMCPSTNQAKLTLLEGFGVGVYEGSAFAGFDRVTPDALVEKIRKDELDLSAQVGKGPLTFTFDIPARRVSPFRYLGVSRAGRNLWNLAISRSR